MLNMLQTSETWRYLTLLASLIKFAHLFPT